MQVPEEKKTKKVRNMIVKILSFENYLYDQNKINKASTQAYPCYKMHCIRKSIRCITTEAKVTLSE